MWAKKQVDPHQCEQPMTRLKIRPPRTNGAGKVTMPVRPAVPVGPPIPDGKYGDIWMCDECLKVWIIKEVRSQGNVGSLYIKAWRQAGPLKSRRVRRQLGWV